MLLEELTPASKHMVRRGHASLLPRKAPLALPPVAQDPFPHAPHIPGAGIECQFQDPTSYKSGWLGGSCCSPKQLGFARLHALDDSFEQRAAGGLGGERIFHFKGQGGL